MQLRGLNICFQDWEHEFEVELMIQGHLGSQTDLEVKTESYKNPNFGVFVGQNGGQ